MTEYIVQFKQSINHTEYFKINVVDFRNFCNSVVSYTKKINRNFKRSEIQVNLDSCKLSYIDTETAIDYELDVAIKNFGFAGGFFFSHKTFLQLLNTIKYKEICISNCNPTKEGGVSNACAIWSDEDGSFCFICNKMQS